MAKEIGIVVLFVVAVYFVIQGLRYWNCAANRCSSVSRNVINPKTCSTKCNFWKWNDWTIMNEGVG